MKKLSALLCLALCLSCVAIFASCQDKTPKPEETSAEETTPEETTASTPAPEETTKDGEDESKEPDPPAYDPALYAVIGTAEDLMALNKSVNENKQPLQNKTVIFTADVDMTGYVWTPLDGQYLSDVIFDGNGHTLSNLTFADYAPEAGTHADRLGAGFVGVSDGNLTFRDLTVDTASITAYERNVGCFVGFQNGGSLTFENCKVLNFTANGWMDYNNTDAANGGHPIAFRLGGFVGHTVEATLRFQDCHVENLSLSGFKDLAAFVGYSSTSLDASVLSDCSVKNADLVFSYCLAEIYNIDMPRQFVTVFFNDYMWWDNIDACVAQGNTYEGVTYYDYTDNNAAYTPDNFRSWSE